MILSANLGQLTGKGKQVFYAVSRLTSDGQGGPDYGEYSREWVTHKGVVEVFFDRDGRVVWARHGGLIPTRTMFDQMLDFLRDLF